MVILLARLVVDDETWVHSMGCRAREIEREIQIKIDRASAVCGFSGQYLVSDVRVI